MEKVLFSTKSTAIRYVALLLSLVMLQSLVVCFSTTAKAAVITVDEENKQYLDVAKLALGVMAAASGNPALSAANVVLFSAIFGVEDTATEQIVDALNEISEKLDGISEQITQMSAQLSNLIKNESVRNALETRINLYLGFADQCTTVSKTMFRTMENISQITDDTDRVNAYKDFLLNRVASQNISGNDFNTAVQILGEKILQADASGLKLFPAYDKLVLYTNKWEHQGYAARRYFQVQALGLYTNLAALSMLSLTAKYDQAVEEGNYEGISYYSAMYDLLKEQIDKVCKHADTYAVVERPADQRYYQVPGHEMLLLAQTYVRFANNCENYGQLKKYVLELGYPTGHSEYKYPTITFFQNLLFDYGGSKSLFDIFFNQNEGNLILPGEVSKSFDLFNASKTWGYQTNEFNSTTINMIAFDESWIGGTVVTWDGKVREYRIAHTTKGSFRNAKDNLHITDVESNYRSFGIAVIPRSGNVQGGAPFFVSGMADSYAAPFPSDIVLSVDEGNEYQTYEWQLSRDGGSTWEIVPDGVTSSLPLGAVDSSMKGYMYRCLVIKHNLDTGAESYYSQPVTLNLECPYASDIYPIGGTITRGDVIYISNPNEDSVSQSVYYTQDGSPVTAESTLYTVPFALYNSATVTAAVYDSVYGWSGTRSVEYTVLAPYEEDPPSGPSTPGAPEYSADVKGGTGAAIPVTVDKDSRTALIDASSQKLIPDGTVITIPSIAGVDTYKVGLPVSALSTEGWQGSMTLVTDKGSITVPSNMLTGVTGVSGSKVEISFGQGNKNNLTDDLKTAIGDRPLISLSLSVDGKQTHWSNPNAPVTVSIPYAPTAEELANPENIVIWYIDGSGNVVTIPNGHYDASTGTVTFTTTHFSDFGVAYVKVSFSDVPAGAWYSNAVSFIAAREITSGTGGGNYSPEAKLTRGEFIVLMMRAYGIAPDADPANNFSDAGNTYYTGYLAAAKQLGITAGTGNNLYSPGREITRQEMFTMLYNALKVIGQLPKGDSGKTVSDFTDAGQIDTWAKEALTLLVETGTVSGSGGKLTPTGTTTRAEMAQVLYNLLSK